MKNFIQVRSWKTAKKTFKSSLKNICATALLLMLGFCANVEAQPLAIPPNAKLMEGGEQGKSYQLQLTSAVGKKGIINDFIAFLDEVGICNKKELQKRIDEIDDKTTDFTVPFSLPVPMFLTHMYGMTSAVPAVILMGDLYFRFISDTVIIDFKNWQHTFFQIYNAADANFDLSKIYNPAPAEKKGFFQALVDENLGEKEEEVKTPEQLALDEWKTYQNQKIMENSVVYKALSVATGIFFTFDPTVDKKKMYTEIKNVLKADYAENINKEFPMYKKLIELKLGAFFPDTVFVEYYNNMPRSALAPEKQIKGMVDFYIDYIEQHKLLAVSEARWEKQIRPLLALFFKALLFSTDSKVLSIGEDGVTTYINIDGMVLPVDPKWSCTEDGTPIVPSDPKVLEKYKKKNEKNQY